MEETIMNSTMSISSLPVDNSWFGIFFIAVIISVILGFFIAAISSLERYKKLWKFISWVGNTFGFFLYGIGGILVVGLPSLFFYWEISNASKGNILPLKWTLIPIATYIVVALIGYAFKKYVVDRVKKYNKQMKQIKI